MTPGPVRDQIAQRWTDDVLPSLSELVSVPAVSPAYDAGWESRGALYTAAAHMAAWMSRSGVRAEVVELPGRTPLVVAEAPATPGVTGRGTVLFYGHLDKQPQDGPWQSEVRDGRLHGRGSADDGYAGYAALTALAVAREHGRVIVLLETGEESGSPDLPAYLDHFVGRLGYISLVVCLDAVGLDYERLWLTSSLRGAVQATVTVRVLDEDQHSGLAGGIVPDSFRVLRQLLDRVEDASTGRVLLPEMHVPIPERRVAEARVLAARRPGPAAAFPLAGATTPQDADDVELLLNNTWRPTLTVTGAAGLPDPASAGAVVRASTSLRLSFRLPPTADPEAGYDALVRTLTTEVPHHAEVTVGERMTIAGWDAPPTAPWLSAALDELGRQVFDRPCGVVAGGGGIPSVELLGRRCPDAQFVVTGAAGPDSNIHGHDESLDLAQARRITEAVACLLTAHARH